MKKLLIASLFISMFGVMSNVQGVCPCHKPKPKPKPKPPAEEVQKVTPSTQTTQPKK